ncbi:hypothetical protein [Algibacter luteus]|uniref:hypothetical protein n=1 Tax=Algibacter luteus TaxID=1178825 RepID=UPI00259434D8|nr:hypothetical protein [Algibacter luteus]WJJ96571.1 hypothetical protein O5O44_15260 [Algibacter luteus]
MTQKLLKGKLTTYSEQGMEGGVLCFQDVSHIKLTDINSPFGLYENRKVWDKEDTKKIGIITNIELLIEGEWKSYIDPITKDEDYKISSLYCGELKGDLNADKRLAEKYNFTIKYSIERLNESYGLGNWKIDGKLPNVILKDGTKVHFGDSPSTFPKRPYGIPKDAETRVSVEWDDGTKENKKLTKELLIEIWDFKGLHQLKETDFLKIFSISREKVIYEGLISEIPLRLFSHTFTGHFDQISNGDKKEWETYFTEKYNAELQRK